MTQTIAETIESLTDEFNKKFGGKEVDIEKALEFAPDHSVKGASFDVFKDPTIKEMASYARSQGVRLRLIFDLSGKVAVETSSVNPWSINTYVMRLSDHGKFKIGLRSGIS